MKKFGMLVLALMVMGIGTARAEVVYYGDGGAGGLLALLATLETLSTTAASQNDDKAAYVSMVLDDADAYVFQNADESATLKNAIDACRTQKGVTGNDRVIAAKLLEEAGDLN